MADSDNSFVEKIYKKGNKARVFITFHWPKDSKNYSKATEDKITSTFKQFLSQYTEGKTE